MKIFKNKITFIFFFAFFSAFPVLAQEREGDLAVMEMTFSGQGLTRTQIDSLSDLIRAKAVDLTKYRVMTKENNLAILRDKKVDMAKCAEAECVIEFGRILKVDKLVTSNLLHSEGTYYLTLKLYDVASASIDKVLDKECRACDFSKLRQTVKETAGELLGGVTEIGTLATGAAPEREAAPPRTQSAGYGTLEVNTSPAGCQTYIDSEDKGLSPQTIQNVTAGERTIVLAKDGYSTTTEVIQIRKGQRLVLNKTLAPQMGNISVKVVAQFIEPKDIQVYLDGNYKGAMPADGKPFKLANVLAGSHTIKIEHPDYETKEEAVLVRHNATEELEVNLAGRPSKFLITSTPLKAKVFIEGIEKGETPFTATLSPGTYGIRVSLIGHKSKEQVIEAKPNRPLNLNFELEALPKGQESYEEGVMVLIPAGDFMMGCNEATDKECNENEKPYHKVYLDTFFIDKYEVSVDEYSRCVQTRRCSAPGSSESCNWSKNERENHPVNCVSWDQARAYCESAGKRLPTEAEWEKAARGTDGRKYPWGDQPASCDYAVINSVSSSVIDFGMKEGCGRNSTWPVGSKPKGASPFGVMDMVGNVDEWVQDWYDPSYYQKGFVKNPQGPSSGVLKTKRGGSWHVSDYQGLHCYYRPDVMPGNWGGFRCARDAK